jgi:hypothetical protein
MMTINPNTAVANPLIAKVANSLSALTNTTLLLKGPFQLGR